MRELVLQTCETALEQQPSPREWSSPKKTSSLRPKSQKKRNDDLEDEEEDDEDDEMMASDWHVRCPATLRRLAMVTVQQFPAVLRLGFRVGLETAICLAVLAPRYDRGGETGGPEGRPLQPRQTQYAAARCACGSVLGLVFLAFLRWSVTTSDVVQDRLPLLVFAFLSFERIPLEAFCAVAGIATWPRIANALGIAVLTGGRHLHQAVRKRLARFLVTVLVWALTYGAQTLYIQLKLRTWTAKKFAEKVAAAVAARRVVRALAAVAEAEQFKQDARATRTRAGTAIATALQNVIRKRKQPQDVVAVDVTTTDSQKKENHHSEEEEPDIGGLEDTFVTASQTSSESNDSNNAFIGSFERAARKLRVVLYLGAFGDLGSSTESRKIGKRIFRLLRSAAQQDDDERSIDRGCLKALLFGRNGPLAPGGRGLFPAASAKDEEPSLTKKVSRTTSKERRRSMAAKQKARQQQQQRDERNLAAFEELFPATLMKIREDDIVEPLLRVYRERSFLSATIHSFGNINGLIVKVGILLWSVFAAIFVFIYWRVPLTDAILAIGTISLALSFAVGSSAANLVSGIAFILLTSPYDIGDRVIVCDIGSMPDAFPMFVEEISAFSTTFRTSFGEIVIVANYLIASKQLLNHGRSPKPWLRCTVKLAMRTSPDDVAKLAGAVKKFASDHSNDWVGIDLVFSKIENDIGALNLDLWCGAAAPWQDFNSLYSARSRLYLFLHAYFHHAGLHFVGPVLPVYQTDGVLPRSYFTSSNVVDPPAIDLPVGDMPTTTRHRPV